MKYTSQFAKRSKGKDISKQGGKDTMGMYGGERENWEERSGGGGSEGFLDRARRTKRS